MKWVIFLFFLCFLSTLSNCKKDDKTTDGVATNKVVKVEIISDSSQLAPGEKMQLQAVAKNKNDGIVPNKQFTWSSSDASHVQVTNGLIVGISEGNSVIDATCEGVSGSVQIQVTSKKSTNIVVDLGATVPDPVKQMVATLQSFEGSVAKGFVNSVPITYTNKENLVFALGKDDQIFLLGMVDSINHTLDAKSTAIAMVKVVLSSNVYNSPSELSNKIQSASSFGILVSSIQQSLMKGISPLDGDVVSAKTGIVAFEVENSSTTANKGASNAKIVNKSMSVTSKDLPYYFYKGLLSDSEIWLSDSPAEKVDVFNKTRLDWELYSVKPSGVRIATAVLPALSYPGILHPDPIPKAVSLEVKQGAFSVLIQQNKDLQGKHALYNIQLWINTMLTAVGTQLPIDDGCILDVAKAIRNERLPDLLTRADGQAAKDYLLKTFKNLIETSFYGYFNKCFKLPGKAEEYLTFGKRNGFLKNTYKLYAKFMYPLTLADEASTAINFAFQTFYYWNRSASVDLCKNKGLISECPVRIEILSYASSVVAGEKLKLIAKLVGANGSDLTSTHNLSWSSSDLSVADVSSDGTVSGIKEGNVVLTVTDGDIQAQISLTVTPRTPANNSSLAGVYTGTAIWTNYDGNGGSPNVSLSFTIIYNNDGTLSGYMSIDGVEQVAKISASGTSITVSWIPPAAPFSFSGVFNADKTVIVGAGGAGAYYAPLNANGPFKVEKKP